jgi:hypothetical protein
MTRLESKISELAAAMGKSIYIGKQGWKDEWFAGCDRGKGDHVEGYGSSAEKALDALTRELRRDAERADWQAKLAAEVAGRLKALDGSEATA